MGLLNALGYQAGRAARKLVGNAAAAPEEQPEKKQPGLAESNGFKSEEDMCRAVADYMILTSENSDDPDDAYQVGLMYYYGRGPYGRGTFTKDRAEGMRWFRIAADRGYAEAQHALGVAYSEQEDVRNALRFFTLAAEQGHAGALAHLGITYAIEDEIRHDPVRSHNYFYEAAVKDDAFAQYAVAENFRMGSGVSANQAEYQKWCRKAAENGEKHAQFRLGLESENLGRKNEAIQWYKKAADNGLESAQQKLDELG